MAKMASMRQLVLVGHHQSQYRPNGEYSLPLQPIRQILFFLRDVPGLKWALSHAKRIQNGQNCINAFNGSSGMMLSIAPQTKWRTFPFIGADSADSVFLGTSQVRNGAYVTQNASKMAKITFFRAGFSSAHLFGRHTFLTSGLPKVR
jgi:hypothetical protein